MTCQHCARLESLVDKQKREIASLKAKLRQSPLQEIRNIRAEILELKTTADRTYQRVCNPNQKDGD